MIRNICRIIVCITCVAAFKVLIKGCAPASGIRPGTIHVVPGIIDSDLIPLMQLTRHGNTVNSRCVAHHGKCLCIARTHRQIRTEYTVCRLRINVLIFNKSVCKVIIVINIVNHKVVKHLHFASLCRLCGCRVYPGLCHFLHCGCCCRTCRSIRK